MRSRIRLALCVAFAGSAAAVQDSAPQDSARQDDAQRRVAELASADRAAAELACRNLCITARDALPREQLERLSQQETSAPGRLAARVLRWHGLLGPSEARLSELPDRELVAHAEGQGARAMAARWYLIHARAPLPAELLLDLGAGKTPREPWLALLRERPRLEAEGFLKQVQAESAGSARRLEWFEALIAMPPRSVEAEVVDAFVEAIRARDPRILPAAAEAAGRCTSATADRVLGKLVPFLGEKGPRLHEILPFLVRISRGGETLLLEAMLAHGDEREQDRVIDWLESRGSPEVALRVEVVLSQPADPAPSLLRQAGPLLDRPALLARVEKLLASDEPSVSQAAFTALVSGRHFTPAVVAYAQRSRGWPSLLRLPPEAIPDAVWASILDTVPKLACDALSACEGLCGQTKRVEALVRSAIPAVAFAARRALLLAADDESARLALQGAIDDQALEALLDALARRPRPWAKQRLAELGAHLLAAETRDAEADSLRERVLVELVRAGDARARERVIAELGTLRIATLRRAQEPLATALTAPEARRVEGLLRGPGLASRPERRRELLRLLGRRPELADVDALLALRASDPDEETRLEALRVLLATPERAATLERLAPYVSGQRPADEGVRDEIYELLGAMPLPLDPAGLELAARLLLLYPLANLPLLRREAVLRPEKDAGPELGMVVDLLRRSSAAAASGAFARVRDELARHPLRATLSTAHLGAALALASSDRALLAEVGPGIAELLLAAPDRDRAYDGIAHLVLGSNAEARKDHESAARHLARTLECFAEERPPARVLRNLLGDPNSFAEVHPLAALAARARMAAARAAAARGERDLVPREIAAAKLLAVGDRASAKTIESLELELSR